MGTDLKLFELTAQYRSLLALEDSDDIPAEVIRDTLDGLVGSLKDKAINVAKFTLSLESAAKAIDEAAEFMHQRAVRVKKRADSIRQYLLLNMQSADIKRIECPEFVISRRENPEAVQVEIDAMIPKEFMVQPEPPPPRPDKKKIKDHIKAGGVVVGCYLTRGEHLKIDI